MTDKLIPIKNSLALDTSILSKLETYDDFLSIYIQLEETSNSFYWLKADLLNEFVKKHGEKSLEALSRDIKKPRTTISNYSRLAKAFPPEERLPNASFTTHFIACFADSHDDKKDEFIGEKRFEWVKKAADEGWSTRRLQQEIQDKKLLESNFAKPQCAFCGTTDGEVGEYILYRTRVRKDPVKLRLHEDCCTSALGLIQKFQ